MKVTKYVPVWIVSCGGVKYYPVAEGETPKIIEGLTDKEITRLLKMKAIKAIAYDDGQPAEKSIEKMNYNELKSYATSIDLVFPGNILKTDLLDMIKEAKKGADTSDEDKDGNGEVNDDNSSDDDTVQE